ncbi:MAG: alpha/beta hydrolase [Thermoleophilia bacterium]|nr:alpha/beta hydrolase [Thermoleophilia bacterium]
MTAPDRVGPTVVDVQGIPVAYEVRGEGRPILLIHGWSADRRYMIADLEPILAAEPGWRRVYLDLPGHGSTPAPDWLATQDQMLSVLGDFIDAVLPGGPFAVAGNSYGGFLTLALIRSLPGRLCGAALLVPDVPAADGTRDLPRPITIHEDLSVFGDLASDEQWIPAALPVHERRMVEEIRAFDMPAYRLADYPFLERLNANYLPSGVAGRPGAPFDRPCLIVAGRQDSTVGYRGAAGLIEELPRATFAVLDLGGHHLGRIERPALFEALVRDWLDRMERGSQAAF